MATFRIEVAGDELLCSFPYDQLTQDALTDLGARWRPASKGAPGAWAVPISEEEAVVTVAERAGYEVEVT